MQSYKQFSQSAGWEREVTQSANLLPSFPTQPPLLPTILAELPAIIMANHVLIWFGWPSASVVWPSDMAKQNPIGCCKLCKLHTTQCMCRVTGSAL
jgi:hypothetical protein